MIQQSHFWVFIHNNWNQDLKEILAPHVHSSTIHKSQSKETIKVLSNAWMYKNVAYTHSEYYSALKRNEILQYATT